MLSFSQVTFFAQICRNALLLCICHGPEELMFFEVSLLSSPGSPTITDVVEGLWVRAVTLTSLTLVGFVSSLVIARSLEVVASLCLTDFTSRAAGNWFWWHQTERPMLELDTTSCLIMTMGQLRIEIVLQLSDRTQRRLHRCFPAPALGLCSRSTTGDYTAIAFRVYCGLLEHQARMSSHMMPSLRPYRCRS